MLSDIDLKNLSYECKDSMYVFDMDEVVNRITLIKAIINSIQVNEKRSKICYSIKANPFIVPYIDEYVDAFEVCSPGELEIVKEYNIQGNKIIYSGVNKNIEDITEAIDYGCHVITVESLTQYKLICKYAKIKSKNVHLLLRLSSNNQFGMSEDDIKYILSNDIDDEICIDGIHYFAGTQRGISQKHNQEIGYLRDFMCELSDEHGIKFDTVEYGPGLYYPYFEGDDFTDTLKPFKDIMDIIGQNQGDYIYTIEMGRFIAGSCGYYFTRIADLKTSFETNWCILEGGINHLNYYGQVMGMKRPIITHLSEAELDCEKPDTYVLCGSLCTTGDIIVRGYELKTPKIGDAIVFHNTGAYSVTEGISLFLSRNLPKVLILKNGYVDIVRDSVNTWKLNM